MPKQTIPLGLQKIVSDMRAAGYVTQTRLIVLKKWFERSHRLASSGIFIAIQESQRPDKTTEQTVAVFHEAGVSVRIIHNENLFFIESKLGLYLRHRASPAEGYDAAARYCEHYDPLLGTGLNGPSIDRIEEITRFVIAMENHETERSGITSPD